MFDFSVAGPLTGMVASAAAIVIGSQLTMAVDPTLLPALPLEILRQSTLGGGIINAILGDGALFIPSGALGSQEVASMTVRLHPAAIAGYISLIVNALSILPIGSKLYTLALSRREILTKVCMYLTCLDPNHSNRWRSNCYSIVWERRQACYSQCRPRDGSHTWSDWIRPIPILLLLLYCFSDWE
jgi:hypothetical protein